MTTPFTTSRNFMTVRFSSDSTTGTASSLAFAARIETVDPPCGPYLTLNATSTPQVSLLVYSLRVDLVSFNGILYTSLLLCTSFNSDIGKSRISITRVLSSKHSLSMAHRSSSIGRPRRHKTTSDVRSKPREESASQISKYGCRSWYFVFITTL